MMIDQALVKSNALAMNWKERLKEGSLLHGTVTKTEEKRLSRRSWENLCKRKLNMTSFLRQTDIHPYTHTHLEPYIYSARTCKSY